MPNLEIHIPIIPTPSSFTMVHILARSVRSFAGIFSNVRIAVAGGTGNMVCTQCGGCQQAILETAQLTNRHVEILCGSGDGSALERHTIRELIPFGFGPANLSDAG